VSEKKSLVHLVEYPMTRRELSELSEDQQAVLAILSYAVSEANVFAKLYIAAAQDLIDDKVIDSAASIQRFVVLRSWSAKLFEVEDFLLLGGKKKKTKDPEIIGLAEASLEEFKALREQEGYQISRDMRNEATSHYSFSAAKKNLPFVSDHAVCNMYLHEQNGNSFYPLGEEVMFIGRLNRRGANLDKEETAALLGIWMQWNISANKWLSETHLRFVRDLVLKKFEKKYARKRAFWVPSEHVATNSEARVPVFYRKEY